VHEERQFATGDAIGPAALGIADCQCPTHRLQAVPGGCNGIAETVSGGVLVVVQVSFGTCPLWTGIEGIDKHMRDRSGTGDLDARLEQIFWNGGDPPIAGVDLRHW
jgi:hypothetical protein